MDAALRRPARVALLAALALGCGGPFESAAVAGRPAELDRIRLPPGFSIDFFARDVPGARSLALAPGGTVFVGSRRPGVVYALVDGDRDGRAEKVHVVARGLSQPNGVAFRDGALYVAEIHRIVRLPGIEGRLESPPAPELFFTGLPSEGHHGWRYLRLGPDGAFWIGIGAPCNVCEVADPFASLSRIPADGSRLEVWARGLRNTVGFDWQPGNDVLWITDNGRDWLGDDRPPDELNRAPRAGLHFGFPHCHGRDLADPEHGKAEPCGSFAAPAVELGPHVAALGVRFYRGDRFPPAYRGRAFIAEHGSWNRSRPIGYRVSVVDVEGERAGNYRTFAEGWLHEGEAWGRPVDLLELPDGSLLLSDDHLGAVYRIAYTAPGRR
jgi:glucose/arabinose dehydrogenase